MEPLLRKYFWVVDAVAVGLCAALLGLAASSLVETRLATVPLLHRAPVASFGSSSVPAHGKRPDAILRRNIFCSTCPPIRLDGDPDPAVKVEETVAEAHLSSLPLRLVAVMYAPSEARQQWNMAVIRDSEWGSIGAFDVGEGVHGATLVEILDTRVYLDNDGASEYLDLLAPPKGAPVRVAVQMPMLVPPRDPLAVELERGIKKLGDRRYEIKRSTLESVMGNLALLSRSARIVPEMRGGKARGFRLFAVRPDGPFAKIGLQNGDVIDSINGLEMSSPEKAIEVYAKLRSASHVELGLERSGQKVAQDYTIR